MHSFVAIGLVACIHHGNGPFSTICCGNIATSIQSIHSNFTMTASLSYFGRFIRSCIVFFVVTNGRSFNSKLVFCFYQPSSHRTVSDAERMHDFTRALKGVIYPRTSDREAAVNVDKQALQLAKLMTQFQHQ